MVWPQTEYSPFLNTEKESPGLQRVLWKCERFTVSHTEKRISEKLKKACDIFEIRQNLFHNLWPCFNCFYLPLTAKNRSKAAVGNRISMLCTVICSLLSEMDFMRLKIAMTKVTEFYSTCRLEAFEVRFGGWMAYGKSGFRSQDAELDETWARGIMLLPDCIVPWSDMMKGEQQHTILCCIKGNYTDDTQLYVAVSLDDMGPTVDIPCCILDIKTWIGKNFLKLNQDQIDSKCWPRSWERKGLILFINSYPECVQ